MTDSIYIPTLADTSEDQAIGANAKFLRGFTLEKFYMIDAGSIVTRHIKEHALVHGSLVIHHG
jgi:acetyltransferase-like isoleucine patch superfamily enzyme